MVTRFLTVLLCFGVVLCSSQFSRQALGFADEHRAENAKDAGKKEDAGKNAAAEKNGRGSEQKDAKEGGEGGPDALSPVVVKEFNFPFDLTVWTLVVFLVVLAVLYKTAWGPIAQGLDNRETNIAGQIAEAARRNEEAKQLLVDYEKRISSAHDEVRQIIEEGRRNSERLGQEILDKAKQQSAAEVQRSKQQIQAATNTALLELAQRSSELAVELAGKIVRQKLTSSDHAQLIGDAVSKFKVQAQAAGNAGNTPV